MNTVFNTGSLKSGFVLAVILGVAAMASGCATRDEDGNKIASNRECRSTESLGSKIRRSVCMTPEQWAAVDEKNAEMKEENGRLTERIFKQALEQGSQVGGPAFDSPTGPSL